VNSLRSLDQEHNSFTLDLFQLAISKEGPGGLAFASKLDFGKTAQRIVSDWNGDGALSDSEETNDFELEEAYLTYHPEWMGPVTVKAGKFVTLLGAEVIEAPSNMNFSRSFMFGFSIPFTHTGVLFSAPLGEMVTLTAGVVNGWDNVVDNNNGKSLLASVAVTPSSVFSISANGTYGPEKTNTGSDPRGIIDLVSTITLDPITLSLNFDYGEEGTAALDGGTEKWTGFAGIVGLALKDLTGIPAGVYVRGEVFDDDGGGRTGTEQTLTEITVTGKYFLTDNLTAWAEYRHDHSDEDSFAEEGTVTLPDDSTVPKFKGDQDTALVALSYVF
jgi:hypothetical protein